MKISKTGKTLIGIFTILQLFFVLGFLIWIFSTFIPEIAMGQEPPPEVAFQFVAGIIIWAIIGSIYTFGFLVFYIVHAGMNKSITGSMKVLWIILLLIFGALAEVVYFFLEIVPENSITAKLEEA